MRRLVYIIILNWNGWEDTVNCVESCQNLDYPNFRILIVDNGSSDSSESLLRGKFPEVEIMQTGMNLGFAGGNNIGIKYSLEQGADYIWLLNNDTVVEPDTLTQLVNTAEAKTDAGMVGSKILLLDRPDTLHFAGGDVNLATGITTHIGAFEKDEGQYDHLSRVDYATGCSLLVKRKVIERIGLMPEEYFLYYEETDWCMHAQKAGFTIHMALKSKVFHKVSGAIEYTSPLKQYYLARNRLFFLREYGENVSWIKRVKSDLGLIYSFLRNRQLRHAKMIIQAYIHWRAGYVGPLNSLRKINT